MSLSNNHPMIIHERWEAFTDIEHHTWSSMFEKQTKLLANRAVDETIKGMENLAIFGKRIPKLFELNKLLMQATGFSAVPVIGFIPEDLFFTLLSERKFPVGCFVRKPHQLDYIEEPDIFHDLFGHIPLLFDPVFADLTEELGVKGTQSLKRGMGKFAGRLYWFTLEFGLIRSSAGLRIYGAGITSSAKESVYCLDSKEPTHIRFNLQRALKTQYRIDVIQKLYVVIENFQQLFQAIKKLDWDEMEDFLVSFPDIAENISINPEEIIDIREDVS